MSQIRAQKDREELVEKAFKLENNAGESSGRESRKSARVLVDLLFLCALAVQALFNVSGI